MVARSGIIVLDVDKGWRISVRIVLGKCSVSENSSAIKHLRAITRGRVIGELRLLLADLSWTEETALSALKNWDSADLAYIKHVKGTQLGISVDDNAQSKFQFCKTVAMQLSTPQKQVRKKNRARKRTKADDEFGGSKTIPCGLPTPVVCTAEPPSNLEDDPRPKWV